MALSVAPLGVSRPHMREALVLFRSWQWKDRGVRCRPEISGWEKSTLLSWEWGTGKWPSEQPSVHDICSKTCAWAGRDTEWSLNLQHGMRVPLETVSTRSWLPEPHPEVESSKGVLQQ